MATRHMTRGLCTAAQSPQVHVALGLVAVVAAAADVLDVALVEIGGYQLGSEVAILSMATLHVLKGLVDILERSQRIRETRRTSVAEA